MLSGRAPYHFPYYTTIHVFFIPGAIEPQVAFLMNVSQLMSLRMQIISENPFVASYYLILQQLILVSIQSVQGMSITTLLKGHVHTGEGIEPPSFNMELFSALFFSYIFFLQFLSYIISFNHSNYAFPFDRVTICTCSTIQFSNATAYMEAVTSNRGGGEKETVATAQLVTFTGIGSRSGSGVSNLRCN